MNFLYARIVSGMEAKEREEFDATLNSGVTGSAWERIEARAFQRLEEGEFDLPDGTGDQ